MGLYNNLVLFDQQKPQNSPQTIVPDLAEAGAGAATASELTFKLRDGVKWHDGKPFTPPTSNAPWTC